MRYLALAAVLFACTSSSTKKAPQRALRIDFENEAERIAVDRTHVYILDGRSDSFAIRRLPRGGGMPEDVVRTSGDGGGPTAIVVDDTHVYWLVGGKENDSSDEKTTILYRAPKTMDAKAESLKVVNGAPGDLIFVGNDLVFSTVSKSAAIHKIDKQGASYSTIVEFPDPSSPGDLLLRDGGLIVCDSEKGTVSEVTMTGQVKELAKVASPQEAAAYGGRLFVAGYRGVFDVPSGKLLTRASESASFAVIAGAPEGVYYRHENQLRFMSWTGSKPQILQKAKYTIEDIIVADEGLYYIDSDNVWYRARVQ